MTNSLIESARRLGAIDAYGNTASAVEALAKVQLASGMPGGTGCAPVFGGPCVPTYPTSPALPYTIRSSNARCR